MVSGARRQSRGAAGAGRGARGNRAGVAPSEQEENRLVENSLFRKRAGMRVRARTRRGVSIEGTYSPTHVKRRGFLNPCGHHRFPLHSLGKSPRYCWSPYLEFLFQGDITHVLVTSLHGGGPSRGWRLQGEGNSYSSN